MVLEGGGREAAWDLSQRILRHRRANRVICAELRRQCQLDKVPSILWQRQLKWFGDAAGHEEGDLIRELLLAEKEVDREISDS